MFTKMSVTPWRERFGLRQGERVQEHPLDVFYRDFDRLFENFWRGFDLPMLGRYEAPFGAMMPRMDVTENEDRLAEFGAAADRFHRHRLDHHLLAAVDEAEARLVRLLGLMIADPRDLVSGKPLAGSDAEHTTNAIQRYRQGTYKMPHDAYEQKPDSFAPGTGVTDQSSSSGSSGSSGSPGK